MPCDHITNCNKCKVQVCSYCVEDCSGCQLEWCKICYIQHQDTCLECLVKLCPDEIEMVGSLNDGLIAICPKCDMQNGTSLQTSS